MRTKMSQKTATCILLGVLLICFSCARDTERNALPEYQPERLQELLPMQRGKYITYRLDSTVPIFQGRALAIRRYQVRDVWDSLITDNLGQPTWRVFRYINDSLASGPWKPLSTYTVTPLADRVEFSEQNLRTVRLQLPLRSGATWKGNRHLPDGAYGWFNYNAFNMIDTWDFGYTTTGTEKIGGRTLNDVWTVEQFNEVTDTLTLSNAQFRLYHIGYSADKYAPGVGLVARQLLLIEHNPKLISPGVFEPYKTGFGVNMWMIDHN